MKSKTSSSESRYGGWFNAGLFRKNLTRFWPLWAVYLAAWLVALPASQFLQLFGESAGYRQPEELAHNALESLAECGAGFGLVMAAVFGCLFAMALFSYLCSARSVGMMHSFPIRREALFVTSYLSGAAVFVFTGLAAYLLAAAVQGAAGVLDGALLLKSLTCMLGQMLFFYSFAVFCTMFTGQLLAIPAFYIILNGLAAGFNALIEEICGTFYYGYYRGGTPDWIAWLTPVWKLQDVGCDTQYSDSGIWESCTMQGLPIVAAYSAAAVVLAVLALLVYRRRPSETAGDTVTVRWMRPVFCYGVGLCMALSIGQWLYWFVWDQFHSEAEASMPAMLACTALMGLVGFFAAEMLLKKSFRVFRSCWKGAAALLAALAVLAVCVRLDVTGVERRVPEASEIQAVTLIGYGQTDYHITVQDNPAMLKKILDIHQCLVDSKDQQLALEKAAWESETGDDSCGYVTLSYRLNDGSKIRREYQLYGVTQTPQPEVLTKLAALLSDPDFQRENLLEGMDRRKLTGGSLEVYQNAGGRYDDAAFDSGVARILYSAMEEDIAAGHFGTSALLTWEEWRQAVYWNSLTLYFLDADNDVNTRTIQFSTKCTYLAEALKQTGVVNAERPLMTYAQFDSESSSESAAAEDWEAQTVLGVSENVG